MENIKSLLKKKNLTGEELGKLIIINQANEYNQNITGKKEPDLVPYEEIDLLVEKLDRLEWNKYKKMIKINSWIIRNYFISSAYEQQAQLNLEKLSHNLNMVEICEQIRLHYYSVPEIMSKKQYEDFLKKREKELYSNSESIGMIEIFLESLKGWINYYRANTRKKSIGKDIHKLTFKEKAPQELTDIYYKFREKKKGRTKTLTKWDIISEPNISIYYECFNLKSVKDLKEKISSLKEFEKDFKEVFELGISELKKYYQEIESLTFEDWFKLSYVKGELYQKGIFDLKEYLLNNYEVLCKGNIKALNNGIAIIPFDKIKLPKESDIREVLNSFRFTPLEELIKDREDTRGEIEYYKELWFNLINSFYFLQGYNKALDLIAEEYELESIKIYKSRLSWFEEKIKIFNKIIGLNYIFIEDNFCTDEDERKKKLEVYKKIFEGVDFDKLSIPEKNIKKAVELIKSGECFYKMTDELINTIADFELKGE